tara:strand:- start:3572 stop:3685 length:114 start_codon:yes stop_codon:yes gene_type:complete
MAKPLPKIKISTDPIYKRSAVATKLKAISQKQSNYNK